MVFERKTKTFLEEHQERWRGISSISFLATVCPSQMRKLAPPTPAAASAFVVRLKTFALGAPECCDPDNPTPQRRVGRTKRNY